MRKLFLISIFFMFTSCFAQSASFALSKKLYRNDATIYLYAPRMYERVNGTIFLNNRPLTRMTGGQFIKFHLPAGHYTFTASTDRQRACDGTFRNTLLFPPFKLTVNNGRTYTLYYGAADTQKPLTGTCDVHIGLTSTEKGLEEIRTINRPLDTYEGSFRQTVVHFLTT